MAKIGVRSFEQSQGCQFAASYTDATSMRSTCALVMEIGEKVSDNPYEILGVKSDTSAKEIKAAYRRLAKKLHPDLNPGDSNAEDRFKNVSAAYNLLKDGEQRARFDRGEIDMSGAEKQPHPTYRSHAGAGAQHHYYNAGGFSDFANESDLFEQLFGYAQGQRQGFGGAARPLKGADIHYSLQVDFLDAALGAKKRVTMPDGVTLDVSIPAGVNDNQILRLKGKGLPGHDNSPNGDALIKITIGAHPYFSRNKKDILLELPITMDEAVLGGKIDVPTLHGRVSMNIPAGSGSGQTLRLKGKGIKAGKNRETGDQRVTLKIVLPEILDDDIKGFFQSWREKHSYDVRQKFEGGH